MTASAGARQIPAVLTRRRHRRGVNGRTFTRLIDVLGRPHVGPRSEQQLAEQAQLGARQPRCTVGQSLK